MTRRGLELGGEREFEGHPDTEEADDRNLAARERKDGDGERGAEVLEVSDERKSQQN
jgi:hypothetical protein